MVEFGLGLVGWLVGVVQEALVSFREVVSGDLVASLVALPMACAT